MSTLFSESDGSDLVESAASLARPPLDPAKTAIVVVDMVNHQITRGKAMLRDIEATGNDVEYIANRVEQLVIPAHQRLLPAARAAGAKVVYLRVGAMSSDYSDVLPSWQPMFRAWEAHDGSWACEVVEALAPAPGDVSMVKSASGGFNSSALDTYLRNMGIEHVGYTGVITNGCVLLTLAAGFDIGYHGYLISDATATWSERLQTNTEESVGSYMARVVMTDDFTDMLGGAPPARAAAVAGVPAEA